MDRAINLLKQKQKEMIDRDKREQEAWLKKKEQEEMSDKGPEGDGDISDVQSQPSVELAPVVPIEEMIF